MTKQKAIEIISHHKTLVDRDKSGLLDKELEYKAIDMAIKALEQEPSEDCISRSDALAIVSRIKSDHVEKDTSINYGTILDIDLALQKLPSVTPTIPKGDDCVSRQAVIDMTGLSDWFDSSDSYNEFVVALSALPPVTPTTCIAKLSFDKEALQKIVDEKVKELVTHGTCKDCKKYRNSLEHCTQWVMSTNDDFYCADFEKKG